MVITFIGMPGCGKSCMGRAMAGKLKMKLIDSDKLIEKRYGKKLQELIDELGVEESLITLDAELTNDLGINSIELADLVMICEDKFDIEISDENIGQFVTIRDVVNYLETL